MVHQHSGHEATELHYYVLACSRCVLIFMFQCMCEPVLPFSLARTYSALFRPTLPCPSLPCPALLVLPYPAASV